MIKLGYKGNLSNDIRLVNSKYKFLDNNKFMIVFDFLLSLVMIVVGYNLNREDINVYLLGLKAFGVCSILTVLKALGEKKRFSQEKKNASIRIDKFAKFLNKNNINVSSKDFKKATVSNGVIVDHNDKILDRVVSYQVKKMLLVMMRDEVAKEISSLRVRAFLINSNEVSNINSDASLYLTQDYELESLGNKALTMKKYK